MKTRVLRSFVAAAVLACVATAGAVVHQAPGAGVAAPYHGGPGPIPIWCPPVVSKCIPR
jgi:hypothetical protein